jgi:predicted unusual protein kinase regulating ubiquinone biosynthesis (AarF/ABC1/UbiB family)
VLYAIASLAERYWPEAHRLHPVEIVSEFERTLAVELDLMREAANAAQLKRNFAGSDLLYVPEIYWDYCRPNVLTIERIAGIQVDDLEGLRAAGTDIKRLAENGVEIFFTQVFRHNFFHADMHPGNIFVDVTDPARPKYVAVDFGIVGTLDERDQHYLAENFLAFFRRDYRRVATLHVDSAWVPAGTRVDELEAAVRAVCEPIFNKPLKDISFGLVLLRLFRCSRSRAWAASSTPSSICGRPRSPCSRNGCSSGAIRARSSSSSSRRGPRSARTWRCSRAFCTARCGASKPRTPPCAGSSAGSPRTTCRAARGLASSSSSSAPRC